MVLADGGKFYSIDERSIIPTPTDAARLSRYVGAAIGEHRNLRRPIDEDSPEYEIRQSRISGLPCDDLCNIAHLFVKAVQQWDHKSAVIKSQSAPSLFRSNDVDLPLWPCFVTSRPLI